MVEVKYKPISRKELYNKVLASDFLDGLRAMRCSSKKETSIVYFEKAEINYSISQALSSLPQFCKRNGIKIEESKQSLSVYYGDMEVFHKMEEIELSLMHIFGNIIVHNYFGRKKAFIYAFPLEKEVLESLGYTVKNDWIYW